jgi:hypothetical protein
MDQIDSQSLVAGYESHLPELRLPDENDRHVLAAAIEARATVLVTFNLAHFPPGALIPFGIQPMHPDTFVCNLLQAQPAAFLQAASRHRTSLLLPPKTVDEYLETLRGNRLTQLVTRLEGYRAEL